MVGNPGFQILKVRDLVLRSEFSQTLEAATVTVHRIKKDRHKKAYHKSQSYLEYSKID